MNNVQPVGQMSVSKFLRIRHELELLDKKIKKICDAEWPKGNFRFTEFNVDSSPIKQTIEKMDEMDEWEQTHQNVGDTLMGLLYVNKEDLEDLEDNLKKDAIFVNNEVERIMLKYRLTRPCDHFGE